MEWREHSQAKTRSIRQKAGIESLHVSASVSVCGLWAIQGGLCQLHAASHTQAAEDMYLTLSTLSCG